MKKIYIGIISVLSIACLILGMSLYQETHKLPNDSIRGTFVCGEGSDQLLLSLETDNDTFILHYGGSEYDRGTIKKIDTNIYTIVSDIQDTYIILTADNTFEYQNSVAPDLEFVTMEKTSGAVTYINSTPDK